MAKEPQIEMEGVVTQALPNTIFNVKLTNGSLVRCCISGKIRKHYIRILVGDSVRVNISQYDLTKGIITFREKN